VKPRLLARQGLSQLRMVMSAGYLWLVSIGIGSAWSGNAPVAEATAWLNSCRATLRYVMDVEHCGLDVGVSLLLVEGPDGGAEGPECVTQVVKRDGLVREGWSATAGADTPVLKPSEGGRAVHRCVHTPPGAPRRVFARPCPNSEEANDLRPLHKDRARDTGHSSGGGP
jgi:hypothetical protein